MITHKYEAEGHSAVVHAAALSFQGGKFVPAMDKIPARLHIELPLPHVAARSLSDATDAAANGVIYTCKVCEGGPKTPDPVSVNVTSCLFFGHTYTDPLLDAARKAHNCRYFSSTHLAAVCHSLGGTSERTGRFGWFCNDVESIAKRLDSAQSTP